MTEDEKIATDNEAQAEATEQIEELDETVELSDVDNLRIELAQAQSEAAKAKEEELRARAEVENIRKRAERDVAAAHKFGLERFIGNLLPIKDSIDLGFDALDTTSDVDAIREGMSLTRKMFDDALDKTGVVALDPTGEAFNPEFHQAMTMQPSAEAAPGTVLAVMQKGYVLNERLIRPAMVVVAKAPEDEAE